MEGYWAFVAVCVLVPLAVPHQGPPSEEPRLTQPRLRLGTFQ